MASSSDQPSTGNIQIKLESPDPTIPPPAAVAQPAHGSVLIGISDD